MSVNASQNELLQLIYRHLKEYGFHSAANELQRHSPQSECSVSASLLDIYSSWLSDPKKKRQQPSANCSSLNNKGRTPTEDSKTQTLASINQTKAEDDSSSDSEELSQSLLPQTPPTFCIKSPPTTPVKPVVTASPRKGKPAAAVSPVPAAASDSSATTDISVNEDNAPAVTAKAVKQKKSPVTPKQARSRKDSPGANNKVGTAAKKQVQTPKKKDGSSLSTDASSAVKASPSVVTTGKKKDKPAAKAETPKKKSVPVKRKTPGGKDGENVSKAKKSKTQMKGVAAAAGGDDSDSDSSLDIEKWKKLVHLMTEDDIIKMAAINALDSSTPQPKKKRVRKPRAVPPANKETQVSQNDEMDKKNEKVEKKNTTDTPAKNSPPKKSRTKKPATVTSPAVPHQEQNVSSVEDRPAASTLSPLKQTPAKQNSNTLSEDKTDEAMSEPKKKKKKKKKKEEEANEDNTEENTRGAGEDGHGNDRKEELKNKSEISEQVSGEKPVQEKKKAKGGKKQNENGAEIIIGKQILNVNDDRVAESVVPEPKKKAKKKKKEKSEGEEDKVNSEQISEKENDSSEQIVSGKKNKKKKKTDVGNSEKTNKESEIMTEENKTADDNSIPTGEEKKKKKKRDKSEDNSEEISKEKKKRKKDRADHNEEMSELVVIDKKKFTEVNSENHNESPLKSDSAPLPPPNPEAPGPQTEKKKRKSKLKSTDVPATPKTSSQDAAALEALSPPSSVVRKKKKKSSESKSPEDA